MSMSPSRRSSQRTSFRLQPFIMTRLKSVSALIMQRYITSLILEVSNVTSQKLGIYGILLNGQPGDTSDKLCSYELAAD